MATTHPDKRKNKLPKLHGLYAITPYHPEKSLSPEQIAKQVQQAIIGGARIVQYRDKSTDQALRYQQALAIQEVCRQQHCLFLVNDDVSLACEVDADGVHLGAEDTAILNARDQLGENAIIGISCYNRFELAQSAQQAGADYIAFGRFFPSTTKPDAVQASIDLIKQAKQLLDLPVACIGGITAENARILLRAGADMLAVIDSIFGQQDIVDATREIVGQFPATSTNEHDEL